MMRTHVELHDSLVAAAMERGTLILTLCPGYLHRWTRTATGWVGEGWHQWGEFRIRAAGTTILPSSTASRVDDGWLEVGARRFDNMVPVPLAARAPVRGELTLGDGRVLRFAGRSIRVRLRGRAVRVERLPDEWAPTTSDPAG